ncbi:hypothetical protein NSND_62175 [Nitrospira sp. ND1]|nr:hypothetical protein NSND_62175 [Nitrospira sp. ND1]
MPWCIACLSLISRSFGSRIEPTSDSPGPPVSAFVEVLNMGLARSRRSSCRQVLEIAVWQVAAWKWIGGNERLSFPDCRRWTARQSVPG